MHIYSSIGCWISHQRLLVTRFSPIWLSVTAWCSNSTFYPQTSTILYHVSATSLPSLQHTYSSQPPEMTDIEYTQEIYKERKFCPLFTSISTPATATSTKQLQQPKLLQQSIYKQNLPTLYQSYNNPPYSSTCWTCLW